MSSSESLWPVELHQFSNAMVRSAGGAAIGGPLGGLLGDTIGWRWAFLIQVRQGEATAVHDLD